MDIVDIVESVQLDRIISSTNYIFIMMSYYRTTKNMSSSKRPRVEESAVAEAAWGGGVYATNDANPPIMPVPRRIANQLADYATYTLKWTWTAPYREVSIGGVSRQQFRINSIYDPDYSGGGTQPLGRDLLAGMYNYYRVLQTDFKCEFAAATKRSEDNVWNTPWVIGDLVGTNSITYPNDTHVFGQMKRGRSFLAPADGSVTRWERTIYPGKLDETIDSGGTTNEDLQSIWTPMGSNPAEEQFYTIEYEVSDQETARCSLLVHAKFTVQFRQPNVDAIED